MVISPSVPILAVSLAYWKGTGNTAWFAIFFVSGYLFFFVLGVPVAAMLLKKRGLLSCAIAGGAITVAPIALLSLLSMSLGALNLSLETWLSYVLLFLAGCLGGTIFWLIAFTGHKLKHP
jgi:hypothetical protein